MMRLPQLPAALGDCLATSRLGLLYYRTRWGPLGGYIWHSRRIPGWTRGQQAAALAQASASLPDGAVLVEIGSLLGCSAVLLAGGRRVRGSGKLNCVDTFDGSGDPYSASIYQRIAGSLRVPLRTCFERNIREAGLSGWVEVHEGRSCDVAMSWSCPIDFLFLDADQSYGAVKADYESWIRFLKPGGVIAIHNSRPGRSYDERIDGPVRLAAEVIRPPAYTGIKRVVTTTFAHRAADGPG